MQNIYPSKTACIRTRGGRSISGARSDRREFVYKPFCLDIYSLYRDKCLYIIRVKRAMVQYNRLGLTVFKVEGPCTVGDSASNMKGDQWSLGLP